MSSETTLVPLSDRVTVLRDEVLDLAELGDGEPRGAEIFDGVVRALVIEGETTPGLDHTLHDAIARRLAWGDSEEEVLADADEVYRRFMVAAQRAFRDPDEEIMVIEQAAMVACATARMVAQAALGRAGRERAARLREDMSQRRLREALRRQKLELNRLDQTRNGF
jgi:hypothetical protein